MPAKKQKPEEIIGKLRVVETMLGQGGTTAEACWTCPGKVESSLEVKGEPDDEAATVHEGI